MVLILGLQLTHGHPCVVLKMLRPCAVCRPGPVRVRSQGESRLRRIISTAARERMTADGVPDQPPPQSMRRTGSSELSQRMWSDSTRSNSPLGSPRRTDSTNGLCLTDMTLSDLARKPPTGDNKALPVCSAHSMVSGAASLV